MFFKEFSNGLSVFYVAWHTHMKRFQTEVQDKSLSLIHIFIIINGSARKGNTLTAINAFIKGASEKNEIEVIEPDKLQIAPCKGCGACQCHKGCVDNDDTNPTIDKIAAADMILFTTPVYWWGMSAQLKLVIDKCYCRGLQLKNKKVGVIAVGGSPVDSIQYRCV